MYSQHYLHAYRYSFLFADQWQDHTPLPETPRDIIIKRDYPEPTWVSPRHFMTDARLYKLLRPLPFPPPREDRAGSRALTYIDDPDILDTLPQERKPPVCIYFTIIFCAKDRKPMFCRRI